MLFGRLHLPLEDDERIMRDVPTSPVVHINGRA